MSTPKISHSPTSADPEGGKDHGFVAEVTALKTRHEAECACLTSTMKNRTQRGIGQAFEKLAQAHADRERLLTMVEAYNGRFEGPQAPLIAADDLDASGPEYEIPPVPPDDTPAKRVVKKVVKKMVKKVKRP